MNFVSDALFDGLRLRALAFEIDHGIKGETLTRIALSRGAPQSIRGDNGPEIISKAVDCWAYESGIA